MSDTWSRTWLTLDVRMGVAMISPFVPLHDGRHPAVEVDRGARDVPRSLRGEERHEVGEFARLRDAAHRDALGQLAIVSLEVAALGAPCDLGGLHETDADGVHEDPVG